MLGPADDVLQNPALILALVQLGISRHEARMTT